MEYPPKDPKQACLLRIGAAALVAVLAFVSVRPDQPREHDLFFWVAVSVILVSVVQVLWGSVAYARLARKSKRLD